MATSRPVVLLVEDNQVDARLIEQWVQEEPRVPFVLERVDRLSAALERLRSGPIVAMLLDLGLPDSQGLDTLRQLKREAPDVPVVVLTGLEDVVRATRALQQGAQDYVVKGRLNGRALVRVTRYAIERQRSENALREANRRLEEALNELKAMQSKLVQQERLRALGQMASGIAHDLNNALSPVLGFCELLLAAPESLSDQVRVTRYVTLIQTGARDAAEFVRQLRDFYRQDEREQALAPTDLGDLVRQAIEFTEPKWKNQPMAQGVPITVATDLEAIPAVPCNESSIREALVNLIFNAVDAMPQGGVLTLAARTRRDQAVLEVRDTGLGMPEGVQERCFEPFFSTKGMHGTGLGLAMVYGILQRHGGEIEVESAVGLGTTMRLLLPLHQEVPAAPSPAPLPPPRALSVLAVDDEPSLREYLREFLEAEGHRAELAADGLEGLQKFRDGRFDLVITDLGMPGLNGDRLAAAIKALSPRVPIVLLTGFGDLIQAEGTPRPAWVDSVVSKPVAMGALRRAIAEAVACV